MPYPWHIWSFELNSTDMSVFIDPLAIEQGNETSKFSVGTSSNKSAVYMDGCLNGGFPIVRLDSHRSLWRQALENYVDILPNRRGTNTCSSMLLFPVAKS